MRTPGRVEPLLQPPQGCHPLLPEVLLLLALPQLGLTELTGELLVGDVGTLDVMVAVGGLDEVTEFLDLEKMVHVFRVAL